MSPPPKKTPGAERSPAPRAKRPDEVETSEELREERQPRGRAPWEERAAAEDRLPSEEHTMPTRKALVVGINDYGGPPNNLPSCVNDANAITQVLQSKYGFNEIHTLRDGEATVARVEDELKWLAKGAKSDDRLVFYFSGHGYTKLSDGVMEEFLVLRDGLLEDNQVVNQTRDLAPGTLTLILDSCFSGGMEKKVFDPTGAVPDVEIAQVKVWQAPPEEVVRDKGLAESGPRKVREFRRFGGKRLASSAAIARTLAVEASTSRAAQSAPAAAMGTAAWLPSTMVTTDEAGQPELNGLVLAACLETETAVASTSKTEGRSAFTYALLRSIERLGASASAVDVLTATENQLKTLGVRQTPLVLERATPGNLKRRGFITLEATSATDSLGYLSEPRFWEGVLTTAMTSQLHALRAIYAKEGELMSTMYQPAPPNYQGSMGGFQPTFGFGQPSPDDVQKFIPVLGPILAAVIPAIVPPIVNSIFSQQKAFSGGAGFGNYQQTSPEEVQKVLPVLGPVLASVIPAILPQIINSLLTQQKSMTPWGGQALGGGQYGYQPQSGWGGQALGGGQYGYQPQSGWGGQGPGQDLTQTVSQSINDALRRIGVQQSGFGSPSFSGRF